MLTRAVAQVGRAPLRLIGLDLSVMMNVKVKGFGGDEEANQIATEWLTRAVLSLELMLGWLIIWLTAHFSMIIIGGILTGGRGEAPLIVLLLVEVIPGSLCAIYIAKLTVSIQLLLRRAKAIGAAEQKSVPAPAWTKRRGLLMALMLPGDWDLIPPLVLATAWGLWIR